MTEIAIALIGFAQAVTITLLGKTYSEAKDAKKYARPTGNGFAKRVEAELGHVRRDIGGLREELRTERRERIAGDAHRKDDCP